MPTTDPSEHNAGTDDETTDRAPNDTDTAPTPTPEQEGASTAASTGGSMDASSDTPLSIQEQEGDGSTQKIGDAQPKRARQEPLTNLYKQVATVKGRSQLYKTRLTSAWDDLQTDISNWLAVLTSADPSTTFQKLLNYHVVQFQTYTKAAYEALVVDAKNMKEGEPSMEKEDFRALVIGIFTAQWLRLRDVVQQRVACSPYLRGLDELDTLARDYYGKLFAVMMRYRSAAKQGTPASTIDVAAYAPLVFLGDITKLTVFNRRVPLMLSIPFGALGSMDSDNIRMAIPHEIAHALFAQVPELIEELTRKLQADLARQTDMSRHDRVLNETMIDWTEEICADLLATALAGEAYAQSSCWVMAGSDAMIGITDKTHPPAILRPMIPLIALDAMDGAGAGTEFRQLREYYHGLVKDDKSQPAISAAGNALERQFRSVPALIFVRMTTMYELLNDFVEQRLLTIDLDILGGQTLKTFLSDIRNAPPAALADPDNLPAWGDFRNINADQFVLDFPADTVPTFATPGVSEHPNCCSVWFLRPLCC